MTSDSDEIVPSQPDSTDLKSPARAAAHGWFRQSFNPFRIATLRGLGVLLPPLLTIILFFWAWNTVERAVLEPVEAGARYLIVWSIDDTHDDAEVRAIEQAEPGEQIRIINGQETFIGLDDRRYCRVANNWIPLEIRDAVDGLPFDKPPATAKEYYHAYVESRYLRRRVVIPAFLAAFIAFLYLTGKLLAAGIGRILWRSFERLINRLPIIRTVYSSVKQVTDLAFNENQIQFNRVIAVEYPRKGIWSMAFVTGDSMEDIQNAVGEPMISVLVPTSPMPATGFTISIPKSETIDLDITLDQAIQFCVSCGVVCPPPRTKSGRSETSDT